MFLRSLSCEFDIGQANHFLSSLHLSNVPNGARHISTPLSYPWAGALSLLRSAGGSRSHPRARRVGCEEKKRKLVLQHPRWLESDMATYLLPLLCSFFGLTYVETSCETKQCFLMSLTKTRMTNSAIAYFPEENRSCLVLFFCRNQPHLCFSGNYTKMRRRMKILKLTSYAGESNVLEIAVL